MLTSERDLDIDGFGIAQSGNHITANLRSVDAHRALTVRSPVRFMAMR